MVKVFLVTFLLGLSMAQAVSQRADVLSAKYDSRTRSVDLEVSYQGGCDEVGSITITTCNLEMMSMMGKATCAAIVEMNSENSCSNSVTAKLNFPRNEMNYKNKNLGNMIFDNKVDLVIHSTDSKHVIRF